MTTDTSETSVKSSVVVAVPAARAFEVFTAEMDSWWNPEHHLFEVERMIVEPRVGGGIIDVGVDGTRLQWSRVLAFEPPHRFVFSWDISVQWQIETDHAKTSEVEVRFVEEAPSRTRVELEHRHLDRHGEGWESMRDSVGSGWANLDDFARVAEGR